MRKHKDDEYENGKQYISTVELGVAGLFIVIHQRRESSCNNVLYRKLQ